MTKKQLIDGMANAPDDMEVRLEFDDDGRIREAAIMDIRQEAQAWLEEPKTVILLSEMVIDYRQFEGLSTVKCIDDARTAALWMFRQDAELKSVTLSTEAGIFTVYRDRVEASE